MSGNKDDSGDGGGSDSEPSEDNMDEEEFAKLIPLKANPYGKKKQDSKKSKLPSPKKQFKQ